MKQVLRVNGALFLGLVFLPPHSWGSSTEFTDEIERNFSIRSLDQLQITNARGDISVEGWALDKIRIKAKRKVVASNEAEAQKFFKAMDFRFQISDGISEISAEYGRGLDIQERLRERMDPKAGMAMTIFAPAKMGLRIWAVSGKVQVKAWKNAVDIRSSSGPILGEDIRNGGVSILCPSCAIQLTWVEGPVRCMGGSGVVRLTNINGPQIYVESPQGAVSATRVSGEQLYVLKKAPLTARELEGRIEFHSEKASISIEESTGFLSGRTMEGDITAQMKDWKFQDKALIESASGNIQLTLPSEFSGDVDLKSVQGKVRVDFPVNPGQKGAPEKPVAIGRGSSIVGQVGAGGEILKVSSLKGNVHIIRGK